jgi:hypothetical protein
MTGMPDDLTETPDHLPIGGNVDVLSDILGSLRLTGGVVIDGEFSGDFSVLAQFGPDHFAPFSPSPTS